MNGAASPPLSFSERSIGIPRTSTIERNAARHLLTYAFAADITRRMKVEPVRRRLEDYLAAQAGLPQDLRITELGSASEKHRT